MYKNCVPAERSTLHLRGHSLYFRPNTLSEAVHALAASGGQILAGGTDFFPSLVDRPPTASVVDISGLHELKGVIRDAKHIRIGGLTTWTEIIKTQLPRCFDALKLAAREIGGIQIQNRGTVAGNLCNASPAADSVPPLLALDAEVELVSHSGTRRMPLTQFILGNRKTQRQPDEILSQVLIPRGIENAASTFLKLGVRRYLVISIAMVAVVIEKDSAARVRQARVSVGSCSVVARRLFELERDLIGAPIVGLGACANAAHLNNLSPIGDVRATAAYRRDAALKLVQRVLDSCAGTA
ncbi:MAG: xanthine dehydrogenase [Candidatus Sulfotelmatobacter sp.]|nr:xanthine dehydrogenase [Candidatus Sulfotelmatobacter sp.]